MIQTFKQLWQNPYIRAPIYLLALYLLYLFLRETRVIWISFLIAYTLAYLAHPLVTGLERRGLPRWLGVSFTMLTLVLLLGGLGFIGGRVVSELRTFSDDIPALVTLIQTLPERLGRILPRSLSNLLLSDAADLEMMLQNLSSSAVAWLEVNSGGLLRRALGIVGGLFQIFIIFILTAYLLYKFAPFSKSALDLFPVRHQPLVRELTGKLDSVVGGYLRAQILIALGVGVAVWLGLMLLGIPLAAALGTLAGIANVIPLLGPIVAGVPAALLALTKGWIFVLGVIALLIAINFIDGNVVSPVVFAHTTRIQPITVILGVAVGLSLFGLWGALLAVPFAAFVKLLYYDYYQESRWYKGVPNVIESGEDFEPR